MSSKKKEGGEGYTRTTVSVPVKLARLMKQYLGRFNQSAVACEAWERVIKELEGTMAQYCVEVTETVVRKSLWVVIAKSKQKAEEEYREGNGTYSGEEDVEVVNSEVTQVYLKKD